MLRDWTRGERPARVDVIVPVYGAAAELDRCLASVFAHTAQPVTLVLDGPQDASVHAVVAKYPVCVLSNEHRQGFASAVNRGMRASTSDVVLLNSDTVVTARWLDKLIDAAYSAGDVGTVTPLSNDATLCSVPRAFASNLIPAGFDTDSFAAFVESVSRCEYPRIPTGVGFCLYIKRALLDDIGYFDEQHFGFGYGEENDFCMRALERGWVHVADDATFIEHAAHASFGASSRARERRGVAAMRRKYPHYMPMIAECMRNDPLREVRARIAGEPRERGIVHVVHGWPPFQHGGTELYAYWLVSHQRQTNRVSVYARGEDPSRADGEAVEWLDRGVRVRIVTNHFTARDPFRRNGIRDRALERDFERFLAEERPRLVHVHHLAGHTFALARVAKRLGIPIVMQLQDWWFLCARVNLLHRDGHRCSGPAPAKCAACATLTRIPFANRFVHFARRVAARAALRTAAAFIAGSQAIRNDYADALPRATPFHVIPYGIAMTPAPRRTPVQRPVRFGYVGAIAPHKGVHVAIEAMRGVEGATLHLWGNVVASVDRQDWLSSANVIFEGTFAEEEKARVFGAMDVLLMPSIGLESFGLVGREAMAAGVPVIATAGGALSEMAASELVPPGDAAALRAILEKIVRDPSIVDRWREQLPRPKSAEAHALEIDEVYRTVLR